jgi:hypothetical protein
VEGWLKCRQAKKAATVLELLESITALFLNVFIQEQRISKMSEEGNWFMHQSVCSELIAAGPYSPKLWLECNEILAFMSTHVYRRSSWAGSQTTL